MSTMSDDALLAAIRATPDDDAPRLVYADWLDEHGQPERAEFIRVQCALARHEQLQSHTDDDIVALWLREDELLAAHHEALSGLPARGYRFTFERGFPTGFSELTLFTSRRPNRSGMWTYLLFGYDSAVRIIETTRLLDDLITRARSYITADPDWTYGVSAAQILHHAGDPFFHQNGCRVSDARYVLDPCDCHPILKVDGTRYQLTSDRVRLRLDPTGQPPGSDHSVLTFDSVPES